VPDVVAPPPRHPRFPLFDGLRAIAVLCVLVGHVPGSTNLPDPLPRLFAHLNIGVVIFFIISGFLLYRPFIAARAGGASAPAVAAYAKRRFLRIFPAYWLVLGVLTIIPGTVGIEGNPVPQLLILHTLPVFGGPTCNGFFSFCDLAQTWSLVAELTFYAVLPVYALGTLWLMRDLDLRSWMWAQLGLLAGLGGLSVLMDFVIFGSNPTPWISASAIGFWLWFACGMGLAVASVALGEAERWPRSIKLLAKLPTIPWLLAATIYVVLSLELPTFALSTWERVIHHVALATVAFLIVLPAVFVGRHGFSQRVLANPLVAWIGLISYGIFLWHFAVAHELGPDLPYGVAMIVTLALSVAIAATSYYLVERPILRFKYRPIGDLFGRARRVRENKGGA
jgi:peptidoglycan/LPS O-acetylase OafA/YrhL